MQVLVAIVRLPKTRHLVSEMGDSLRAVHQEISAIKGRIEGGEDMDKEIDRQINEVRQEIAEIHKQASNITQQIHDIRSQVGDARQQVEAMVHQINGLTHHRLLFESDVMPRITEALQYQENLVKSLPVVLRRHERKLRKLEN